MYVEFTLSCSALCSSDMLSCFPAEHHSLEYEVFIHYYSQLVCCISAKALSPHFVTEQIMSHENHLEISAVVDSTKAAGLLLTKVASALNAGVTEVFYKFLYITEKYGSADSKTISSAIRKKLKSYDKGVC